MSGPGGKWGVKPLKPIHGLVPASFFPFLPFHVYAVLLSPFIWLPLFPFFSVLLPQKSPRGGNLVQLSGSPPLSLVMHLGDLHLLILHVSLLGPFHGAIAVPSVTRCRCRRRRRCRCCRGHRCAGGARQYRWRHLVNGREAARSREWAQHFSNPSCILMQQATAT